MISLPISALLWLILPGLVQQETDDYVPQREIVQTVDRRGIERCLGSMVGFQLTMQCRVGADGQGEDCEVQNPTAASRRNDHVFQCMASKISYHYTDGTPAVGELVIFRLGGKTSFSEDEYRRYRDETRQKSGQPSQ